MTTRLHSRRVVLGVCGGIAAYKSVELARRLGAEGAFVTPILTTNATRFIGPLTLSAVCGEPARTDLFEEGQAIAHTTLGQTADVIVIAPATARFIASLVHGDAKDLLMNTLLASRAPVVVCPAMHTEMWENAAVQANLEVLEERGVIIVPPGIGQLAGGDIGVGRLAEFDDILAHVRRALTPQDLCGQRVCVTAGGTREAIDPVRFLSNRSSGKQGLAIAKAAWERGAEVCLVTTMATTPHRAIRTVSVDSAAAMLAEVSALRDESDVIVMAAAVADFRPVEVHDRKLKKADGVPVIALEPTVDILAELGRSKRAGQVLVGFAAETNDLDTHAQDKLVRKGADFIVGNDVSAPGVGFEFDTNAVTIYCSDGYTTSVALASKDDIAHALLDRLVEYMTSQQRSRG